MTTLGLSNRFLRLSCAALLTLVLGACGGTDDDPPPAAVTIGPAGGTLDGPNGAQLVVPANALAQPVALSIAQSAVGAPALPPGSTALGATFALTPHGTTFAVPVTLQIPFDPSLLPAGEPLALWKTNAAQDGWEPVPGAAVSGNRVQAQIASFSWVMVVAPPVLPTISVQPKARSVVEPADAGFAVGATGETLSGVVRFQWKRNGVPIGGATGSTYSTGPTSVAADNAVLYSVDVTNRAGTVTSRDALLTVTAAPEPPSVTDPADATTVVGGSAVFSVVGSGTSIAYQWQRLDSGGASFDNIRGATGENYTLSNAQIAHHNAKFRVRVTTPDGQFAESNAATLTVTAAPATATSRIAAGDDFSLAANVAGTPYSWGTNATAGLGNVSVSGILTTATPLPTLTGVNSVAANTGHGVAVKKDGTVWAWGYRGYIDCGVGQTAVVPMQVMIANAVPVHAVSTGISHTLLLSGSTVLSFGCTDAAELGRGGPGAVAARVLGLPPITAVAAGHGFSLALDIDGNVWSWGLGVLGYTSAASPTPVKITGLSGKFIAIAAGAQHALALRHDGSVWAWGSNGSGELGDGTTTSRTLPVATLLTSLITAIAAGRSMSLAIGPGGSVQSWGENGYGQLGSGSTTPFIRSTPAAVLGLGNVVEIAVGSGSVHALAVDTNGVVWAWGNNDAGQLGDGTTTSRATPVAVSGLNLN